MTMYNDYTGGTLQLSQKGTGEIKLIVNGNTSLLCNSSGAWLQSNGDNRVYGTATAAGLVSPNDSRWVQVTNTSCAVSHNWSIGSDRRLKNSIAALDATAKSFINNLKPVSYKLNDIPGKTSLGFIAQDVETIQISDIVYTDKDGMKSLVYTEIIAPLVLYVQDLQEQIDELKQEGVTGTFDVGVNTKLVIKNGLIVEVQE